MSEWRTILAYQFKIGGFAGIFRRIRFRLVGPSKRELLARINAAATLEAERSRSLAEQIDATLRYVVCQTVRESEERIISRLLESFADPHSNLKQLRTDALNNADAAQALSTIVTGSIETLRRDLDAYARKQSFLIIDPASELVLVSDYGFDILVPASERGLLLHFMRKGFNHIENGVRQLILDTVKAGDTVIDIGANVGLHALLMARLVGSGGHLHAFEPHPLIVEALRQTMVMNGFADHVTVQDKVVLDNSRSVDFWTGQHSPTSSVFAVAQVSETSYRCQAIALDDYLPPGTRVDFVKMDAEGAEPLIIAGMQRVLSDNPAICLVLEVSQDHFARSGLNMSDFYLTMVDDGFTVSVLEESGSQQPISDLPTFLRLENANIVLRRIEQPAVDARAA